MLLQHLSKCIRHTHTCRSFYFSRSKPDCECTNFSPQLIKANCTAKDFTRGAISSYHIIMIEVCLGKSFMHSLCKVKRDKMNENGKCGGGSKRRLIRSLLSSCAICILIYTQFCSLFWFTHRDHHHHAQFHIYSSIYIRKDTDSHTRTNTHTHWKWYVINSRKKFKFILW